MMDDKYFDEQLARLVPSVISFMPVSVNEIDITVDNRDHFEEVVLHESRLSADGSIAAY